MAATTVMEQQNRKSAVRSLVDRASALVVAMGVERGCGFLSNILAARIGGAGVYGAYSLALSTANNIASYAGAGIGVTASRFSGEYPEGTPGHRALRQALILVSAVSALLAVILLYWGAEPVARVLLHNPSLTGLLRIAAFSSGGMIVFECCRGYLLGQTRRRDLVLLSVIMGVGVLATLPVLARSGPRPMVIAQTLVSLLAVAVVSIVGSVIASRRKGSAAITTAEALPGQNEVSVSGMAGKVWRFGGVQLAGVIGLNASGWWVASLIARSDLSLVQMGLFAVASQLRNLVALVPGLLAQSSIPSLSSPDRETTDHVLGFGTVVATTVSILLGTAVILPLPYLLPLVYGKAFSGGVLAATVSVATAVVHMSASPTAARLNIIGLRTTGVINTLWAVLVAGLAYPTVVPYGASGAAFLYFGAHLLSALLVVLALVRRGELPGGVGALLTIGCLTPLTLTLLAWTRQLVAGYQWVFALAMVGVASMAIYQLYLIASKYDWIPHRVRTIFVRRRFA